MAQIVKQVSTVLNDAIKATLGKEAPTTIDTSNFVSVGAKIDAMDLYEDFFKQLCNRIVKTVYFMRSYRGDDRYIMRDEHEYGAFVQKVYYTMPSSVDNPEYSVAQGADGSMITGYTQHSPYDVEATVPVQALVYGGQGTWAVEIIRPVDQIRTAFTSASAMDAFIDGIYLAVQNRYEVDVENLTNLAVATDIAMVAAEQRAVNLLDKYNKATGVTIKASEALQNADFLKYASREIKNTIDFMSKMSTVFNGMHYETFTPRDNMVVEVLSQYASATATYLEADTYHNEMVALPKYREVPYWQFPGTDYDFNYTSAIKIKNDALNIEGHESDTVELGGIIAVIRDTEAVAAYFSHRRVWEKYNERDDIMIHGETARKGYAVDRYANSVVFYIADAGDV